MAGTIPDEQFDLAYDSMLAAEGSDWFWWYGTDKDSGNDSAFDIGFREILGQVYDSLDLERPDYLLVPIIQPTPIEPDVVLKGTFTPIIDGKNTDPSEWQNAGSIILGDILARMDFGFDSPNLYLSIEGSFTEDFSIYFGIPRTSLGNPFSDDKQVLGFYSNHRLSYHPLSSSNLLQLEIWDGTDWLPNKDSQFVYSMGTENLEIAIPFTDLSTDLATGDDILLRIESAGKLLPNTAPTRMGVPDLGTTTWLFSALDPVGDDHGPGSYTYPTDGVFKIGVFDLETFDVGIDGENLVLRIKMVGPVENPWGGSNDLSIQLVDIYLDNIPSSGSQSMRDARSAAFPADSGWDYVLTLAGWNYGVFAAENPEVALSTVPLTILTDPANKYIIAKVPLSSFAGDPLTWGYGVAILSNDGYGKNGARDVAETGGQWVLGGALPDKNHTRIIDYLWPIGLSSTQEEFLSNYSSSTSESTEWTIADYPQVFMYYPSPE